MSSGRLHILRRARTAAALPARLLTRVEALEDRSSALEAAMAAVPARVEELRAEIAGIRLLLDERLAAQVETSELVGRLLQAAEARLEAIEQGGAGRAT